MTLGAYLAIAAAAILAAYAVLRLLDLLPTFTDVRILIGGTGTEDVIARTRRDVGNRAAFDAIYASHDDPWDSLSPRYRYQQVKYDRLMRLLPSGRFCRVLDIGCGFGVLSRRLAERADHVIGLDLVDRAVARARVRNADVSNLEFLQSDVFDLSPELNGSFDLVLLVDVLYYAPDTSAAAYQAVAARVAALLRPGGVCVVVDHYFGWIMDRPTRLANVIHDAFRKAPSLVAMREYLRPFYLVTLLTRRDDAVLVPAPVQGSLGGKLLVFLAGIALVALVGWLGVRQIGLQVLDAGWALPLVIMVHLVQLFLSALAWKSVDSGGDFSAPMLFHLRIMREGINSLLPVAQIGGFLVNVRILAQRGVKTASAAAGAVLDLWAEGIAQALFLLLVLALLASLGRYTAALAWLGGAGAMIALGLGCIALVPRFGLLRKVEDWAIRQAGNIPFLSAEALRGFDGEIRRRFRNRRRVLGGVVFHFLAWALGGAEVWLILRAMGAGVSPTQALVIEGLGTAIRSVGFMVPAGLGVQEGGFILACGLFGIPPATAVALSMVKRLREVLVGTAGLMFWWRTEWKHRYAGGAAP